MVGQPTRIVLPSNANERPYWYAMKDEGTMDWAVELLLLSISAVFKETQSYLLCLYFFLIYSLKMLSPEVLYL